MSRGKSEYLTRRGKPEYVMSRGKPEYIRRKGKTGVHQEKRENRGTSCTKGKTGYIRKKGKTGIHQEKQENRGISGEREKPEVRRGKKIRNSEIRKSYQSANPYSVRPDMMYMGQKAVDMHNVVHGT